MEDNKLHVLNVTWRGTSFEGQNLITAGESIVGNEACGTRQRR